MTDPTPATPSPPQPDDGHAEYDAPGEWLDGARRLLPPETPDEWLEAARRLVDGDRAAPSWSIAAGELEHRIDGLEALFGVPVALPVREAARDLDDEARRLSSVLATALDDVAAKRRAYNAACQVVAQMHAAALGEVRGPIQGVVEDVANVRAAMVRALDDVDQGYRVADRELAAVRAELTSLQEAIARWKRSRAVHPDTANRALRAARAAHDAVAEGEDES